MDYKELKQGDKTHGRKATASKLTKASSTTKNIKMYISLALTALVIIIVASNFLNSPNLKQESNQVSSTSVTTEETTKSQETQENDKDKDEEIQKLKDRLKDLDTKISESEELVSQLRKETHVPKLDIEALRNNDLSSLKGTWRTPSGNEYVINESGEMYATSYRDGQKFEYTVELDNSYSHLKNRSSDSKFKEIESISAHTKGSVAGGFVVVAVPSGVVMQPGDDGKLTDRSNHDEERLFAGQQYEAMLLKPEDVYYRVKPDTSKLEEEEKNLAQLQADREAIKTSLETKDKKN